MATTPSYGKNSAPSFATVTDGNDLPPTGPAPSSSPKKHKTDDERLALLKSRLRIAKTWSKRPHDAWKKWVNEFNIEDFGDTDEIRDKVRIGYIFRRAESDLPAIFDDQPEIFIKGRTANTEQVAPLIEGTYDFLWDIQHLDEKIEDCGTYFLLLGMGFIESPWVTKTQSVTQNVQVPVEQEDGSIMPMEMEQQMDVPIIDHPVASVPDPFKLYFSPETIFAPVLDSEHCPFYFHEHTWTPEAIKEKYGIETQSTEELKLDEADTDAEIAQDTTILKDDLKRTTVYEYYGTLPKDMAPDKKAWDLDKDYHILFTAKEELMAEECPYPNKPLLVVGNYGLANKFWKFGEAKHLMPLVQELEMYRSQILQHTRKMANPKPLLPATANIDEVAFRDPRVGHPVKYDGMTAPSYLQPGQLGREVEVGVNQVRQDLEQTSGSFQLENGSNQSTVRTPRGIEVFSEAADKNVRRKRKKVARLIRELICFQFTLVAKYWKPEDNRTLTVIAPNAQGPQQVQVTQEVLEVIGGVNQWYQLDIEVESLSINRANLRQDALDLWGLASAHPDIFNLSELAKWLLQSGFSMKDGDRFLLTDQQRQQLAQQNQEKPNVNVQIKADAGTAGTQLLENEGLLQVGQGAAIQAQDKISEAQANVAAQAQNTPMTQQQGPPGPQGGGVQ